MKKSVVAPKDLTGIEREGARSLRRSADDVPRGAAKPPQTVDRYQRFTDDDLSEALLTERDGEDDDLSSADDMERDDTGARRRKGASEEGNRRRAGSAGAGSGERARSNALVVNGAGGGSGAGGRNRHHGYASEGGGPAASAAAWNDGAAAALMGERRFPKRGGRSRMRRPRMARKGRVSAYCIAKEIKVAELLEYFVTHRNRHQWLDTPRTRRRTLQSQPPPVPVPAPPALLPPPPQQQGAPAPPSSAVSDVYSPLLGAGTLRSHTYGDKEEKPKDKDLTSKVEEGRAPAGGGGGNSGGESGWQMAPSQGGGGGLGGSLSPRPVDGGAGGGAGGAGGGSRGAGGVTFGPGTGMGLERLQWRDTMYVDVVHSSTSPDPVKAAKAAAARRRNGDNGDRGEDYANDEAMGDEWNYKDVMYFRYGCVVFYNCTVEEEKRILLQLKPFIIGPVSDIELEESQDDMNFVYADPNDPSSRAGRIKNDEITFETRDPLEKVSYAFGMAQSAKLFVFEERLEGTVSKTQRYPEELARLGRITLTEKEINRMIGKVLVERNEVNLHSDVLDTPEFFWEADRWEPGYQKLTKYLDIPVRVEVLNQRLDVLRELLDVLNNQIENRHAVKLELIIIWLIVLEVVIECFWNVLIKDILGFFPGSDRAAGW